MLMPLLNLRLLQLMQGCCKRSSSAVQVADFAALKKIIFLSD
jgi:hypothetical protein